MTRAHGPSSSQAGGTSPPAAEVTEELCRVQAELLDMGEDNYRRLCRVCPDPERRYRVLRARVDRALAAAAPPGYPPRPVEGTTTLAVGRGVELELEWQGEGSDRGADPRESSPDAFVAGEPRGRDQCWRCNARGASGELGLCDACHADLAGDEADETTPTDDSNDTNDEA